MGEADWISAALYCNRSTFNRMRRVAIKAGLLEGAGARDIRMGTVSEIAQYQRARDPERMADFNASIAEWQRITIGSLRANLQRLGIGKGELYESLRPTTHKNKYGEIDRIGFSFARQGIYIHKGAYRGFGGYKGSRWSYRKATMKFIGLDCGWFRRPFEPVTAAQYRAYARRFAALGVVRENQAD